MRDAMFVKALGNGDVECFLCPHYCRLKPSQTGICQVRHNIGGKCLTSSYGRPVLMTVEPIEKKYLFHAFPGTQTLSIGTPGCNLRCQFCINWPIAQRGVADSDADVSVSAVIAEAVARKVRCIAFTYTEPTIYIEYVLEVAQLARAAGLSVVLKSNGYMTPSALERLSTCVDAMNIDLKGWRSEGHAKITGGLLEPVLEILRMAKRLGIWVELSTLIVPGLNETSSDLVGMANFIASDLGRDTPWHLLRFYPSYRMLVQPVTSEELLERAVNAGRRVGLNFIYSKELFRGRLHHTYCTRCGIPLIERMGFSVIYNGLKDDECPQCGMNLVGIGLKERTTSRSTTEGTERIECERNVRLSM